MRETAESRAERKERLAEWYRRQPTGKCGRPFGPARLATFAVPARGHTRRLVLGQNARGPSRPGQRQRNALKVRRRRARKARQ